MTVSAFGWLDHDEGQRRKMLQVIELFKEEGTVDELGIGTVRDTFADLLFPGTSVLHTRARYLLFVPWIFQQVVVNERTGNAAARAARRREVELIYALLHGETVETSKQGIIGRVAKEQLKRMPSAAYWHALGAFGIRAYDGSTESYFGWATAARRALRRLPTEECAEPGAGHLAKAGWHPSLPAPAADFLTVTDFRLSAEEADFLQDRICASTGGTLFSWLLTNGRPSAADFPWLHAQRAQFPGPIKRILDHGKRFSEAIHGAALLYNLMLAQKQQSSELAATFEEDLRDWATRMSEDAVFDNWDRADLWGMLYEANPRLPHTTRRFIDRWIHIADTKARNLSEHSAARRLIHDRERRLKGGLARLDNPRALEQWSGHSGLGRLDYRWNVTARLLDDIYAGLSRTA
jgi:hypothetical protein